MNNSPTNYSLLKYSASNYNELLRNENENRYMVFTITEKMDFELLNSIDIMQVSIIMNLEN